MTETWKPAADELPLRPTGEALKRGFLCHCPNCNAPTLFKSYLKIADSCSACGEDFTPQRADDGPAYFTILIVGHIVVPLLLWVEIAYQPPEVYQMLFWLPFTAILSLVLLRPIKGALVGYQWAKYMHGFDKRSRVTDPALAPLLHPISQ